MSSKIKTLILSSALLFAGFSFANAAEVNYPGFSGNINTTLTTGLSVRVDENCLSKPGGRNLDATFTAAVNANRSADASALIAGADGKGWNTFISNANPLMKPALGNLATTRFF